ncbi:magnesium/cobalt transporter CorA [Bacillus massiliglaciei]|uniref:magnesium/cobalt transporter CorA n=1 Tax=Bacillus massiliglaciei TaxID=1816693 RepID=UPI000AEA61A3|nr:magnesium/cobalt transporter CorA [Bacillus massiliglaciei]
MIRTCLIDRNDEIILDVPIEEIDPEKVKWYWADFDRPDLNEIAKLSSYYPFHQLAVEDCIDDHLQRPKINFYEGYHFLIIDALREDGTQVTELDMFVNQKWIVTYHKEEVQELKTVWEKIQSKPKKPKNPMVLMHHLIDEVVDQYFPQVYEIESRLNELEDNTKNISVAELIDQLFDLRSDLSRLRRTILPMRDLLYRMVSSERLNAQEQHLYFTDVYDHLLKLTEMVESYREFSSDIRDNYLSVNSNNMNETIMTLTVFTTIFMPLTFIAGIYGMNFEKMPELKWDFGYYIVLGLMAAISILMAVFFYKKGWIFRTSSHRNKNK